MFSTSNIKKYSFKNFIRGNKKALAFFRCEEAKKGTSDLLAATAMHGVWRAWTGLFGSFTQVEKKISHV